jgi:Ca2+-binding RTX toxin-like protein
MISKPAAALVVGALALALGTPAATAATASLDYTNGPSGGESFLTYTAAHGERNDVVISAHYDAESTDTRFVVVDRGATSMHGKRGCKVLSRTSASCRTSLPEFFVETGDRTDRVDIRRTVSPGECSRNRSLRTAAAMRNFLTVDPGEEGEDPYVGFDFSDDVVDTGSGDDIVIGSCSDEAIYPGDGRDVVRAGAGNDAVGAAPDGVPDRFDLGMGADAISFPGPVPMTIDLGAHTARPTDGGDIDAFRSAEVAEGGEGADHLVGSTAVEGFIAGAGDDQVETGPGPDFVACEDGHDVALHDPADILDGCESS